MGIVHLIFSDVLAPERFANISSFYPLKDEKSFGLFGVYTVKGSLMGSGSRTIAYFEDGLFGIRSDPQPFILPKLMILRQHQRF